jgi:tripartite-type tricarboxylate transporter receptor subunit TctC
MNYKTMLTLRAVALYAALTGAHALAQDADFPTKPIRMIVPFPAGSLTDNITRLLGQSVSKTLGQPVIIENKPGAQGSIGAQYVARAEPDGYTLLSGTNSTQAANVHLISKLGYDPVRDFSGVVLFSTNPQMLVVRAGSPYQSVADLVAHSKAKPDEINYGVGNAGSKGATQMLISATGLKATEVTYPGTPQALTDLVGGRLHFVTFDTLVLDPFIKSGKVRPLGVTSAKRMPSHPNVPTLQEAGVSGYEYNSWNGLFAPAKTPKARIEKLHAAFAQALSDPEMVAFFTKSGMVLTPLAPAAVDNYVTSQIKAWERIVKDAGIKPL